MKKLADFKNGKLKQDEAIESDDEEDSEYDVFGGDMCLYDSKLDTIDELNFMKETVDGLYQNNF